jgi:ABC-2 type transport system ATP-binding protein
MSASQPVLQARGLTKRYGTVTAVDGLTFDVQRGEIFGFLGPNGAGKTTTISIICGLLKPDGGEALIHGRPASMERRRIGMCPQNVVVWEKLTCIEQLEFSGQTCGLTRREARRNGEALLGELGLLEKRGRLASSLSGGMRRRLNLALSLVHDPEILVLDEPEAGLDPQSRVLVREYVRSLAGRKTILLTTHNMDEAERLAHRVAIVDHGRLLVMDTPEALTRAIGQGDVLEVDVPGAEAGTLDKMKDATGALSLRGNTLVYQMRGAAEALPTVLSSLHAAGMKPASVHLHPATLEDVFLTLTGRRLRE